MPGPIVADIYSDGKEYSATFQLSDVLNILESNECTVAWVEVDDKFDYFINMPFAVIKDVAGSRPVVAYGRVLKTVWDTPEH